MRGVLLEAVGVLLDEVVVDGVPLEQQRADRLEQRQVAVDPDRQVQVGERGAAADHAARRLRVLEADQPRLRQRVDRRRSCAPFLLAFSSAVSIRGWLVPGFWPTITISSAVVDVVEA